MSIRIIKAGIADSIRDGGRFGYQSIGVAPCGYMDPLAACLANILTGNALAAPLIEIHYPAPIIFFEKDTVIAITGADFCPKINGEVVPMMHPLLVKKNSILECQKRISGARAYISTCPQLAAENWLGSYSTDTKAKAGGWHGRALKKDDVIPFQQDVIFFKDGFENDWMPLPFSPDTSRLGITRNSIDILQGPEWHLLQQPSREALLNESFILSHAADRMGYRLQGPSLYSQLDGSLVSTPVALGTIQLLPGGQLIILMADHQTTGGYPRIAQVTQNAIPQLAQASPGDAFHFGIINLHQAEKKMVHRHEILQQMQAGCQFRLSEYFKTIPHAG